MVFVPDGQRVRVVRVELTAEQVARVRKSGRFQDEPLQYGYAVARGYTELDDCMEDMRAKAGTL